jgi:hypothetical protein
VDLLSIVQSLWRHKLAALPVIALTILGVFYVVAVKAPEYQASESLLLLSPPGAPSPGQVAADPKLGKINPNNPYVSLTLPVTADAVINVVTSATTAQALVQQGADPRYQVTLSTDFGTPPILQITGVATTPARAIRTADLVAAMAQSDLRALQKDQGVNDRYLIKTTQLVAARQAQRQLSGTLRTLIAVLALGVILMFIVISVADVAEKRRSARAGTSGTVPPSSDPAARPAGTAQAVPGGDDPPTTQLRYVDHIHDRRLEDQRNQRHRRIVDRPERPSDDWLEGQPRTDRGRPGGAPG